VNLNSRKEATKAEFFVVPSSVLKERTVYTKHPRSEFWSVYRDDNPNKGIKGVLAGCVQRLKLTGAAILVFRASTSLKAAPAA